MSNDSASHWDLKLYCLEKLFSYGVALALVVALSPQNIAYTYYVLGLPHYILSYLYQRGPRSNGSSRLVISLGLLAVLYAISHWTDGVFTVFAATFLLFHVITGEFRHLKVTMERWHWMMLFAMMGLLGVHITLQIWSLTIDIAPIIGAFSVVAMTAFFGQLLLGTQRTDPYFVTLFIYFCVVAGLDLAGMRPDAFESYGFITIAHFLTVYFNSVVSLRRKNDSFVELKTLVKRTLLLNTAFLVIFAIAYVGQPGNLLFNTFFHPLSFYAWTVTHFLTSLPWHRLGNRKVAPLHSPTLQKQVS